MNKYNMELPEYKAFKQIKIGSNILNDTINIFNISGYYPIIIGKGDLMPKVWLYALVNGRVRNIINNSNSSLLQLKMEYDEESHKLTYTFVDQVSNKSICILSLESNNDLCFITKMDLRPLGLKIFLDDDTLFVGTIQFKNSNFSGGTFVYVE